jgi:acyl-CoA synthetase (NDP forming)
MHSDVQRRVSEAGAIAARKVDVGSLLAPRSVAVIGASADQSRVGGRALNILRSFGYDGAVYVINPKETAIGDVRCFASIADLPEPVDLAIVCLRAAQVPDALRECGRRGIASAVVFADGFAGDAALCADLEQALAEARAQSGLRILGPNTIGFRVVDTGLFATFAADVETGVQAGSVAMIGQSGGLSVYFGSAFLKRRGVGSKYVIDTGNEFDIDAAECLDHIAEDEDVTCVALILEGCRDGRALVRAAAKAIAHGKSVVCLKTGRSKAGLDQVASHTGALAGSVALFEQALRDVGVRIARDETELMDAVVIASAGKAPRSRRVGVVTPSGGFAILTLDAAEQFGIEVPEPVTPPNDVQRSKLAFGSFANPLDYSATMSAGAEAMETALSWMASQPNIDAVILWQAHSILREDRQHGLYPVLKDLVAATDKPIFLCGLTTPDFEERLRGLGVLSFEEPTRLVRALGIAAPPAEPVHAVAPTVTKTSSRATLGGERARVILGDLPGLPHVASYPVESVKAALDRQRQLSCRVILKVESDRFPHKSDLGLVSGAVNAVDVAVAFGRIEAARQACGAADVPIVMQPFERGFELALGAYIDPAFGPSVMVASGGIFLEIIADTAFALAPITQQQARKLILSLRGAPILLGARGQPAADIDAAAAALADLSQFISRNADAYQEIDINPLIVREKGKGVVAVDALLVPRKEVPDHV